MLNGSSHTIKCAYHYKKTMTDFRQKSAQSCDRNYRKEEESCKHFPSKLLVKDCFGKENYNFYTRRKASI